MKREVQTKILSIQKDRMMVAEINILSPHCRPHQRLRRGHWAPYQLVCKVIYPKCLKTGGLNLSIIPKMLLTVDNLFNMLVEEIYAGSLVLGPKVYIPSTVKTQMNLVASWFWADWAAMGKLKFLQLSPHCHWAPYQLVCNVIYPKCYKH